MKQRTTTFKRWWMVLGEIVVLMSILAGCTGFPHVALPQELPVGATPEEALQQLLLRHPDASAQSTPEIRIHGTRNTPNGTLVLYSADYRNAQGEVESSRGGFALLAQQQDKWFPTSATTDAPPAPSTVTPVQFFEFPAQLESGSMFIVYGWTNPTVDIATIEVKMDTGTPMRDTVTDGMFAVTSSDATVVCALRAFNPQGEVLYEHRPDPSIAPPEMQQRLQRCPPD